MSQTPPGRRLTRAELVARARARGGTSALATNLPANYGTAPNVGLAPGDRTVLNRYAAEHGTMGGWVGRKAYEFSPAAMLVTGVKDASGGHPVRGAAELGLTAASVLPAGAVSGRLLGAGAGLAERGGARTLAKVLSSRQAHELARGDVGVGHVILGREEGDNPRARGTNPRAKRELHGSSRDSATGKFISAFNPRARGENPRAGREAQPPVSHYELHTPGGLHSTHPDKASVFSAANLLREQGVEPQIKSVRAHTDPVAAARAELKALEEKHAAYDAYMEERIFNKRAKLDPGHVAENRAVNTRKGKILKARSGKDAAGRVKGSSSRFTGMEIPKSPNEQLRQMGQREIDKVIDSLPKDHPAVINYHNERERIQQLREALNPLPGDAINVAALGRPGLGIVDWETAGGRPSGFGSTVSRATTEAAATRHEHARQTLRSLVEAHRARLLAAQPKGSNAERFIARDAHWGEHYLPYSNAGGTRSFDPFDSPARVTSSRERALTWRQREAGAPPNPLQPITPEGGPVGGTVNVYHHPTDTLAASGTYTVHPGERLYVGEVGSSHRWKYDPKGPAITLLRALEQRGKRGNVSPQNFEAAFANRKLEAFVDVYKARDALKQAKLKYGNDPDLLWTAKQRVKTAVERLKAFREEDKAGGARIHARRRVESGEVRVRAPRPLPPLRDEPPPTEHTPADRPPPFSRAGQTLPTHWRANLFHIPPDEAGAVESALEQAYQTSSQGARDRLGQTLDIAGVLPDEARGRFVTHSIDTFRTGTSAPQYRHGNVPEDVDAIMEHHFDTNGSQRGYETRLLVDIAVQNRIITHDQATQIIRDAGRVEAGFPARNSVYNAVEHAIDRANPRPNPIQLNPEPHVYEHMGQRSGAEAALTVAAIRDHGLNTNEVLRGYWRNVDVSPTTGDRLVVREALRHRYSHFAPLPIPAQNALAVAMLRHVVAPGAIGDIARDALTRHLPDGMNPAEHEDYLMEYVSQRLHHLEHGDPAH